MSGRIKTMGLLLALVSLLISGCAGATPSPTNMPVSPATLAPTTAPAATDAPTTAPAATDAPATSATATEAPATPADGGGAAKPTQALRFVTTATGNEARYRIREQLANRDLPNDAIGATSNVSGTLTAASDGTIMADLSSFVIDLRSLASDSSRRDGFVRNNILQSDRFPNAIFVPTAAQGLPSPLPESGQGTFELSGDLTIRDVTRPVVWQVTLTRNGNQISGTAATSFTFKDFNLTQPRVPVVLSVQDLIKLELDFQMEQVGM